MTAAASGRLHALDNLRALMMWLGIVLHVAANHLVQESPLPWQDDKRTPVADLVVAFIHSFRMPEFFVLAGFFVAMLVQSRGPAGMARHRAMRLGLPFAVMWLPVFIACIVFGTLFVHLMLRGTWGFDTAVIEQRAHRPGVPDLPRGLSTMHMWFLWMLLWMSLAAALLARIVPPQHWARPAQLLRRVARAWWGPIVLALPLVATDAGYPQGIVFPSGSFLPPLAEWVHYLLFFVVGLALHGGRDELFAHYLKRWPAYAAAGLAAFLWAGGSLQRGNIATFTFAYGLTAWLWSFALIGMALRWLPRRNAVLGYVSDSSYWVYLVHLPLTIIFGAMLYTLDLPALVKMLANITATTLVCLASYHLLVRFTWVGLMLNGKRHSRPRGPAALTPA